ncbi:MAG: hypothetical protein QRY74_01085 [Chlamydia sp.]
MIQSYKIAHSTAIFSDLPVKVADFLLSSKELDLKIVGYIIGLVAVPISIAFTPITIVADIIVGIAEAVLLIKNHASDSTIANHAFQKIIINPFHQVLSSAVRYILFLPCPLLWPLAYRASKEIIHLLSSPLQSNMTSIFLE